MSVLAKLSVDESADFLEEQDFLRILIIRPGETIYDIQRHIQGSLNLHLTEHGQQEVSRIASELDDEKLDQLYTSPNSSALETAERIASHLRIPRKILKGLRSQDHGLWEGMRVEEIQQHLPKVYKCAANTPTSVNPPNGEAFSDVERRIRTTIQWILKRHRTGTIGLVICEPLASVVRCFLKSEEAKNLWDYIGRHGLWEPVEVSVPQFTNSQENFD